MTVLGTFRQQPDETLDYDLDYSEFLPDGDYIVTATIVATPTMPTPPTTAISPTQGRVKVWVYAGGTDGTTYKLTVLATTYDGRVKEAEIKVKIKED